MSKKIQLHTSFEKRNKQHRNTCRKVGWGQGLTEGVPFTKALLHPRYFGTWIGLGLWALLVKMLPWSWQMCLGRGLGHLMQKIMKSRVYVVQRNVELAFPEKTAEEKAQLTRSIFENAGMAVFETGVAWFWSDKRLLKLMSITDEELQMMRELVAKNPRVLVVSCHLVTLEIAARVFALLVQPGIGVYRSSDQPVWEYVQVRGRLRSNDGLIDRKDVRSMVRTLMHDIPLFYLADQDHGKDVSVFVPFFGVKEACTITGIHDLARVRNTSVLPYWVTRTEKGYTVHAREPLADFPTKDALADTVRTNKLFEEMIGIDPAQYLWMHRRFKSAPDGAEPRYPDII